MNLMGSFDRNRETKKKPDSPRGFLICDSFAPSIATSAALGSSAVRPDRYPSRRTCCNLARAGVQAILIWIPVDDFAIRVTFCFRSPKVLWTGGTCCLLWVRVRATNLDVRFVPKADTTFR